MAVNHADGHLILSIVFYPIAAAAGAVHGGAGWLMVPLVPIGLGIGMGVSRVGRGIVYSVLGSGLKRSSRVKNRWIKSFVCFPYLVLYLIAPPAIAWSGILGVWAGSVWLARHLT